MCDIDGLTCPRDCFDVGHTYGRDGSLLAAMWRDLAKEAPDLADWQRTNLEAGWDAGRADFEACEAAREWFAAKDDEAATEQMAVPSGDEIPF